MKCMNENIKKQEKKIKLLIFKKKIKENVII